MQRCGPESVRQWWDACHSGSHPEKDFFLTGHQGPEVWQHLQVRDMLAPGLNVLNIGVGQGHCTRNLAGLGCRVAVLDISPLALEKVREATWAGYLAGNLEKTPSEGGLPENSFDLALSFLVTQHMEHTGLEQQLKAVICALKPEGIFAIQYAFPLDPQTYPADDIPDRCKVGGVVRTPEVFEDMVRRAGGHTERHWEHSRYPQYDIGWCIAHIRKGVLAS